MGERVNMRPSAGQRWIRSIGKRIARYSQHITHARHRRSRRNSIRLEQFNTRNIWKTESDLHTRIRIFDYLGKVGSDLTDRLSCKKHFPQASRREIRRIYKQHTLSYSCIPLGPPEKSQMVKNFMHCPSLTFFRFRTPCKGKDERPRGRWQWEIKNDHDPTSA
jgi:hypothetical protein